PADRDPQLLALRGVLYLEDGQPDMAVSLLEPASAAAPRQPAIQLQLARAYLASGRSAEAVALFDGPIGEGAAEAVETAVSLLAGYAASQDSEAAQAQAAAVLTNQPDDAQAALGVGLFRQALGDAAGARQALEQSLRLDPALPATRLTLAGLALAESNGEEAGRQYRALLERTPDHVPAMLGLAQVAREAGRLDEAAAQLARAIDADPDGLSPRLALARLELGRDALGAARAAIDAAAARHPGNPEIATFDGLLRFREGQGEAAVAAFRRAATGDPDRAERWLNLGRAEAAAGNLTGARESLQRALRLAPGAAPTLLTLAQVELELGALETAREHARALQRAQPQAADGYRIEADVSAAEGDWRDADRLYVSAYERRPEFDTAFRSYQARREAGIAEPAALLARWAQLSPEDSRARLLLAQQLQAEGAAAAAIREYRAVIQRDPDNVVALNNAAWLLGEAGEPAQGLDYARRALAQAPEAAPVLDTYGWLLVQSGRVSEGLSYLEQAVALAPRAPELQLHLGRAQVQAGRTAAARDTLGRLQAAHPEFAQREGVARLLAELQN
ncbi:MAG: PEP-CTERM system TPR-repeat protein PrsT, partial [Gammaproteobacteria bacterium]|nr:PEP-CTERM system TPR-repeat protein PrsT [Gammaproteobacteria bacterium]